MVARTVKRRYGASHLSLMSWMSVRAILSTGARGDLNRRFARIGAG